MTYSFIPGDTVEQNSPFHIPGTSAVFRPKATLMCLGDFLSKGLWGIKVGLLDEFVLILIFFALTKLFLFQTFGRLAAIPEANMGLVQLDTVAGTLLLLQSKLP